MTALPMRTRALAAWALGAALFAPRADAAEGLTLRATTSLPRADIADGRAVGWRNVGVAAESEWIDADVKFASCLPAAEPRALEPDRSGCAVAPAATAAGGVPVHQIALTFKAPRSIESAPLIDLTLRQWRATAGSRAAGERNGGTVAELVVTQEMGGDFDTYVGYSVPVFSTNGPTRLRPSFGGVIWHWRPGARLELIADRGTGASTAIDRSVTLRFAAATSARNTRFAAWTTRSLDERTDAWRMGAGLEVTF